MSVVRAALDLDVSNINDLKGKIKFDSVTLKASHKQCASNISYATLEMIFS